MSVLEFDERAEVESRETLKDSDIFNPKNNKSETYEVSYSFKSYKIVTDATPFLLNKRGLSPWEE